VTDIRLVCHLCSLAIGVQIRVPLIRRFRKKYFM